MKNKYKAFTLAEILIVLSIIGIVAAETIPTIINDTKNAELVIKLKKEYAVLQQTYKLLAMDAGGSILYNPNFNCSGTTANCETNASANAMNDFANRLNLIKKCNNNMGCWYDTPLKFLGGTYYTTNVDSHWNNNYGKAILSDGTMMRICIFNTNCSSTYGSPPVNSPIYNSICGSVVLDVNGAAPPNQMGRDYFVFWITRTGIYPVGIYNGGFSCETNSSGLSTSDGCAGKVLSEGDMNY